MTDQQLRQAQEIKRRIAALDNELEKFDTSHPDGINIFLPKCGTLIDDVKKVFIENKRILSEQFKEL